MDFAQRCETIRTEGAALARAAGDAGLASEVPTCPEWTIADLLSHIGRIHRYVREIVGERASERPQTHWSETEAPTDRLPWFAAGADALAETLLVAGENAPAWSWTPEHTAGFWARRQAAETTIHRVDAELALGEAQPVAHDAAVDAIDEFLWLIPYWPWAERVRGNGETLHLHSTDGTGEWFVRLEADGVAVTREHAKGDVAARGTASSLLLYLYGRGSLGAVEVLGDASVLTRFRELVTW